MTDAWSVSVNYVVSSTVCVALSGCGAADAAATAESGPRETGVEHYLEGQNTL